MSEIRAWLEGLELEQYGELFEANDITPDLARDLSDADLKDLGVASMGHRKALLRAIETLTGAPEPVESGNRDSAPEAERRQITVMFCDLVGSTALSEQLDPEDLRELMQSYQQAAGAVIERYEGHVAQYLGDGLMVYFGWPQAHEDDAQRAVRAGLDIVGAVAGLDSPVPLAVRVGIASGLVVVGDTGGGDPSVAKAAAGKTPNLAARVQALAVPGGVTISESVRRLIAGAFALEDLGEAELKGVSAPTRLFRVVGESGAESRFQASHLAGLTPLVGRDSDVDMLLDRWARIKEGEGQAVLLSGEAGIGKSRITEELELRIAAEPHARLRYQCSPYHTNSAFFPIIDQLARAAGFDAEDSAEARLDKLEELLSQGAEGMAEAAALLAGILGLPTSRYPPLSFGPQKQKQYAIAALAEQAVASAAGQPLLIVFEDAHWCDPSTLELLGTIIDRIQEAPVLMVITYRPEFDPPWTGFGHVVVQSLGRLTRRQSADLVTKVTGGKALPQQILDQIVAKTDGVALFVEELTKTVLEAGFLQDAGGDYTLDSALPELAIPSTLRDSLMARLDRLASAKEVAQIGACIGREFSYALLSTVSPFSADELRAALVILIDSELVFSRGSPPEATYSFKHALVQDAAYESLLKRRRQALHAAIGAALEDTPAASRDIEPGSIATHFARGADWPKATRYFREAAKKATRAYAVKEALSFHDQALDAAGKLEGVAAAGDILAIHRARADLYFMIGDFSRSRIEWSRNLEIARRIGDREAESVALVGTAAASMWEEDFDQALASASQAIALGEAIDAPKVLAGAHNITGSVQAVSGNLDGARKELDKTLAIARAAGSAADESLALFMSSNIENWQGRYDKAVALASAGARLSQDNRLVATYLRCNYAHAISLTGKGAYDQALVLFIDGLQLAEKLGDVAFIPRYQNGLGWLYMECQDFDRGFDLNRRCAEITRDHKHAVGVEMTAFAEINMADILFACGDLGAALEVMEGVHRICVDPTGPTWMRWRYSAHLFVSLGRLWLTRGEVKKAGELAERCLSLATATESRKYIAKAWLLEGEIAIANRARPQAEQLLAKARDLATAIANPPLMAATRIALGDLHADNKRDEAARQEYRAAGAIAERVKGETKDPALRRSLEAAPLFRLSADR